MHGAQWFSPDYFTARRRFREAADRVGYRLEAHDFEVKGPGGEPLTLDVATLGAEDAERVVVVSSGLHGVEGFFGSAVQLAWLAEQARRRSRWHADVAVVLLHSLNPYGFAWLRRWNERNVDLNRNFLHCREFLDDRSDRYHAALAAYERLSPLLNPPSRPSPWEPTSLMAAAQVLSAGYAARRQLARSERPGRLDLRYIWKLGLADLKEALPVGQYKFPGGLFFGGWDRSEEEETTRLVRSQLPRWIGDAPHVLHLDLHTGLGKYGECKLLAGEPIGPEPGGWLTEHFGASAVEFHAANASERTSYAARGVMSAFLRQHFSDRRYDCLTAEFGTYSPIRVLSALRAENRAHHYSAPGSTTYCWAKHQLMEAFCPAARSWRDQSIAKGLHVIERALEVYPESRTFTGRRAG